MVRKIIAEGETGLLSKAIANGDSGMQLFDQHLLDLVNTGLISMETAIYASSNPEELERSLRIE